MLSVIYSKNYPSQGERGAKNIHFEFFGDIRNQKFEYLISECENNIQYEDNAVHNGQTTFDWDEVFVGAQMRQNAVLLVVILLQDDGTAGDEQSRTNQTEENVNSLIDRGAHNVA